MSHRDWDPEAVKEALDLEMKYHDDKTPEAVATQKLKNSAAYAADAIIHLAIYSENESIRLKAATYITDRVMGKITDQPLGAGSKGDLLKQLLDGVVTASN